MREPLGAPLLLSKITAPPIRQRDILRERLLDQIPREPGIRLLLATAPAGAGKTTLLAEWGRQLITGHHAAVAWYTLDATDNDARRFGAYLIAALSRATDGEVDLGLANELLAEAPRQGIEGALAALLNTLAATPREHVLILDDYHVITSAEVHVAVSYLLDHLPPQSRIAIGTRADPPLQLARLRLRDQLVELRASDLRFDEDEIEAFFHKSLNLSLSPTDVHLVDALAEGWAAGLQMLALSLASTRSGTPEESIADVIARVGAQPRHAFEYLADEVFEQQPLEVRSFLLLSSVLEQLSAGLCDAVVGSLDMASADRLEEAVAGTAPTAQPLAERMLDHLEHTNMFLAPLDVGLGWYRYHHVFRDFLRERLRREMPAVVPTLHRRAATWYQQTGLLPEAIEHALAAGAYDQACGMIEAAAEALTARGEYATVHSWLERLPKGIREERPALSLWNAWDAILRGQLDLSEPSLASAEQSWQAEGNQPRLGEVWHARAHLARLRGNAEATIHFARAALADLAPEALTLRAGSLFALGAGYLLAGDLQRAETALHQARSQCQSHNELALIGVVVAQGDLLVAHGQLHDAETCFLEALTLAKKRHIWGYFEARIRLAGLWLEWDQVERACAEARDTMAAAEQSRHTTHLPAGYLTLGRALSARGDTSAALTAFSQAEETARRLGSDLYTRQARAEQACLQLARGDVDTARQWRSTMSRHASDSPDGASEAECQVLARLLLVEQRWSEAYSLLQDVLTVATAQGRIDSMIKIEVLQAQALDGDQRTDQALQVLEHAVALAEPGAYCRTFRDHGSAIADLLRQGLSIGAWGLRIGPRGTLARGYARTLLDASNSHETEQGNHQLLPGVATPGATPTHGRDALSGRELDVLRLIARGNSNQEIADTLTISLGTVKSHLSHIMSKLQAHNRTEAVAHARELGWLTS